MLRYVNGYILYPALEKALKRDIFSKFKELKKFQKLTPAQQNEIQKRELIKGLEFCQANVPYYKEVFKAQSFDIKKIENDIRFLEDLPLLTKEIVRDRWKDIKLKNARHKRKTGGSTGQSVHFFYDNEGLDWTSAINLMAYEMAENYLHRKDCHISSELGIGPSTLKSKIIDFTKLSAQNRLRLMIHSFSDEDLEQTFKNLKSFRPYLMQGHPSTAYALAEFIERQNKPKKKYCDVFEPSGEMLTDKMVKAIEENLGCQVVNRYGNAEFGVVAHSRKSDPYTKLQVFDRCFYAEEVENGPLVFTNFTNLGMPLLRYDTGDTGTVKKEADGTFVYDIQGRIHDNVDIEGQNFATHYIMDYLDHRVKNIRQFQIVVKDDTDPIIKIVPEKETDKIRIYKEIKEKWPVGLHVEFIKFEDLETVGWRNKFRYIIDKRAAYL